jgi:hypothetical protein
VHLDELGRGTGSMGDTWRPFDGHSTLVNCDEQHPLAVSRASAMQLAQRRRTSQQFWISDSVCAVVVGHYAQADADIKLDPLSVIRTRDVDHLDHARPALRRAALMMRRRRSMRRYRDQRRRQEQRTNVQT